MAKKKEKKKMADWEKKLDIPDHIREMESVSIVEPKFITRPNWNREVKEKRRKQKHKVATGSERAFQIDIVMGLSHVMQKYDLTKEEALAEATRLVRGFDPHLVRP